MDKNVIVRLDAALQAIGRGSGGYESDDPEHQKFTIELQNAARVLQSREAVAGVFDSIDDRDVSLLQAFLAREGTHFGGELRPVGPNYEAQFDNLDPRWIWSLRDWIKGLRKHDFVVDHAAPQPIGNDYRIAMMSDWGTGLYGAPECTSAIQADGGRIDLVLHLGDIYYAGDDDEVKSRFLDYWPTRAGALSRALNGNHEMYSGGHGYFEAVLKDPQFAQPASYFALRNEHWLLVALDTAYVDFDLHGEQAAWVTALAAQFPDHKLLLFSHHQPFSYFEAGGPKLVHKLADLLTHGRVAAWYWGHEHSCVRYDLHPNWKMYGRCVGHSGFPYFRFLDNGKPATTQWVRCDAKNYIPGCLVLDGPNEYVPEHGNRYGPNGYVMLELRGNKVHEAYCNPAGRVLDEFEFDDGR